MDFIFEKLPPFWWFVFSAWFFTGIVPSVEYFSPDVKIGVVFVLILSGILTSVTGLIKIADLFFRD